MLGLILVLCGVAAAEYGAGFGVIAEGVKLSTVGEVATYINSALLRQTLFVPSFDEASSRLVPRPKTPKFDANGISPVYLMVAPSALLGEELVESAAAIDASITAVFQTLRRGTSFGLLSGDFIHNQQVLPRRDYSTSLLVSEPSAAAAVLAESCAVDVAFDAENNKFVLNGVAFDADVAKFWFAEAAGICNVAAGTANSGRLLNIVLVNAPYNAAQRFGALAAETRAMNDLFRGLIERFMAADLNKLVFVADRDFSVFGRRSVREVVEETVEEDPLLASQSESLSESSESGMHHPAKDIVLTHIKIWLPVVVFVTIVIVAFFVMGSGLDIYKDTVLFRTTNTINM